MSAPTGVPYDPSMSRIGGIFVIHSDEGFTIGSTDRLTPGMSILKLLPEKPEEPAADYRTRLLMWEQVELNRWFGKPGCLNTSPESGYHRSNGEFWLAKQPAKPVSAETRKKMSEAKRGRKNPKATPCKVGGRRFDSATEAARFFGVQQQVMHLWLTGAVPWPGTGPRSPRRKDLIGLTGHFLV